MAIFDLVSHDSAVFLNNDLYKLIIFPAGKKQVYESLVSRCKVEVNG